MSRIELPQLVFSTRAAEPTSGLDSGRQLIAATPGIPTAVQTDFTRRADLVGSVMKAALAGPVYSFSLLSDGSRRALFARTVAISRFRQSHQLLTHGLLIAASDLEAMGGNPFCIEALGLAAERSSAFLDKHPGTTTRLGPVVVDVPAPERVQRHNTRRLERLGSELASRDGDFPSLWEGLAGGGTVGYVLRRPDARIAEWLLLHLHPDDRAEMSFHTFFSNAKAPAHRFLMLVPEDLRDARMELRQLRVVEEGGGRRSGMGDRVLAMCRARPARYAGMLLDYGITLFPGRRLPLLQEEQGRYKLETALRDAAGESLDAAGRRCVRDLQLRRGRDMGWVEVARALGREWSEDRPHFWTSAAAYAASLPLLAPSRLEDLMKRWSRGPVDQRWALLALLAAKPAGGVALASAAGRARAWRRLAGDGAVTDLVTADGTLGREAAAVLFGYLHELAATPPRSWDDPALAGLIAALLVAGAREVPPLGRRDAGRALTQAAIALAWLAQARRRQPSPDHLTSWLAATCERVPAEAADAASELVATCARLGAVDLLERSIEHLRGRATGDGEALVAGAVATAARRLQPLLRSAAAGDGSPLLLHGLCALLATARQSRLRQGRAETVDRDDALIDCCLPGVALLQRWEDLSRAGVADRSALPSLRAEWLALFAHQWQTRDLPAVMPVGEWLAALEEDLARCPVAAVAGGTARRETFGGRFSRAWRGAAGAPTSDRWTPRGSHAPRDVCYDSLSPTARPWRRRCRRVFPRSSASAPAISSPSRGRLPSW